MTMLPEDKPIPQPHEVQRIAEEIERDLDDYLDAHQHKVCALEYFYALDAEVWLAELLITFEDKRSHRMKRLVWKTEEGWRYVEYVTLYAPDFAHPSQHEEL